MEEGDSTMPGFAPVEYQRNYYENTLSYSELFPREYGFYRSFLGLYIKGESVLNGSLWAKFYARPAALVKKAVGASSRIRW